jgi:hypothetical protein
MTVEGKQMRFALGVLVLAMTASAALACQFDIDCQVGSRCVKSRCGLYGICAGGLFPGNSNDRVPVRDPLDLNQTVWNTCSFDIDCGSGSRCAKGRGSIDGVCVRGR